MCPNCHSQTKNFRASNKNKRKKEDIPEIERNGLKINYCRYCGKEILNYRKEKKYCSRECYLKHCSSLEASTKASKEQLINAIEKYSTLTEISKALNISRPTVKKYLQQYDLLDILKSKYNFRAIPVNQYNSDMTIVKTWPSITDAENALKKEDIPEIERNGLKINYCRYCGKEILNYRKEKKYCSRECYLKHCSSLEASTKASKEQLINAIEKYSTLTEISKALNISRPTVKKYLQQYDLLDILKSKYNFRAIPVNQYNSDMTIVKTWPSITDAENALKIYGIEKVCKFKRNSAGGYI